MKLLVDEKIIEWLCQLEPFAKCKEVLIPVYLWKHKDSYILQASGKPEIAYGFFARPMKKVYWCNTFLHTHISDPAPSAIDLKVKLPFFVVAIPSPPVFSIALKKEPPTHEKPHTNFLVLKKDKQYELFGWQVIIFS